MTVCLWIVREQLVIHGFAVARRPFPNSISVVAGAALALLATPGATQTAPDLASAAPYAIVSETFTNTSAGTTVDGDVCFTTGPDIVDDDGNGCIFPAPARQQTLNFKTWTSRP